MTVYGCAGYGRPIGGAVTDGIEAVHSLETIDDQGLSVPPPLSLASSERTKWVSSLEEYGR